MKHAEDFRYAVVFPGQGSQYVGMGRELAERFPVAEATFQEGQKVTGLPIKHLAFAGLEDDLKKTEITQPCLLATNIASYSVLKEVFPLPPSFICGHSAGEYAALVASGILSFADAMRLAQCRGELMSNVQGGSMVALLDANLEFAKALCEEAVLPNGTLVSANINSPSQVIVSGDDESIESILAIALDRDITCVPLSVSGAFHSPLLQAVSQNFGEALSHIEFTNASIPVISNTTAQPVLNGQEWMNLLARQMVSPVLWEASIRYIYQQGVEIFIEVGPRKILSKLIQEIIPSSTTFNVENIESLEQTMFALDSFLAVNQP